MTRRDARGLIVCVTGDEAKRIDHHAIEALGMASRALMEVAGQRAAEAILTRTGHQPGRGLVLCGPGNNGGDGYVVARVLQEAGWTISCLAIKTPQADGGDAASNAQLFERLGGKVQVLSACDLVELERLFHGKDLIVDALLGVGLNKDLSGAMKDLVERANAQQSALRVALDVPTGFCATKGRALGQSFRADLTLTFGLFKLGLSQSGPESLTGSCVTLPIGWPQTAIESISPTWRMCDASAVARALPARKANAHKGTHGHTAIIGGRVGMEGAAVLSALGAMRVGSGLTTWYCETSTSPVRRPPELMTREFRSGLLATHNALLVGPGLGRGAYAREALDQALALETPLVLDADALNELAPLAAPLDAATCVLTPHPGEAARLLGCTSADVEADRPKALEELVRLSKSVVVLKGAGTLIGAPGHPSVCVPGSAPALASGGTGDVLAGMIAGLLAQGLEPMAAAYAGAWLHLRAGQELGALKAARGVLASEVADALPGLMNTIKTSWSAS